MKLESLDGFGACDVKNTTAKVVADDKVTFKSLTSMITGATKTPDAIMPDELVNTTTQEFTPVETKAKDETKAKVVTAAKWVGGALLLYGLYYLVTTPMPAKPKPALGAVKESSTKRLPVVYM